MWEEGTKSEGLTGGKSDEMITNACGSKVFKGKLFYDLKRDQDKKWRMQWAAKRDDKASQNEKVRCKAEEKK